MRVSINWAELADDLGKHTSFGTDIARWALEQIIGISEIDAAVDLVIDEGSGWNVAQSVLVYVSAEEALDRAYRIYQRSDEERAVRAVRLIKDLGHAKALAWISDFLGDSRLGSLGIDVLDQLIWVHAVDPEDPAVQAVLALADQHALEQVRMGAAAIRAFVAEEKSRAT